MHTPTKLALTALVAALVLAGAICTASARRIEMSTQLVRATWTGEHRLTFEGGGVSFICPMTVEGSFHSRTISKVCGAIVGAISRAATTPSNCEGIEGFTILPATLPWRMAFIAFHGTLPRITSIRGALIGLSLNVLVFGTSCLYQTTEAQPGFGEDVINEAGVVTGLRFDETIPLPLREGSFVCPNQGTIAGAGTFTQQGTTTAIRIRLVQ